MDLEDKVDDLLTAFDIIQETSDVTVLDLDDPEIKVETPHSILSRYTELEDEKDSLEELKAKFEAEHQDIFEQYQDILNKIADKNKEQSSIKEELTKSMSATNNKSIKNTRFKVSYVAPTVRKDFDKDKFKTKYPVLYKQFIKTTNVKDYIKITKLS